MKRKTVSLCMIARDEESTIGMAMMGLLPIVRRMLTGLPFSSLTGSTKACSRRNSDPLAVSIHVVKTWVPMAFSTGSPMDVSIMARIKETSDPEQM